MTIHDGVRQEIIVGLAQAIGLDFTRAINRDDQLLLTVPQMDFQLGSADERVDLLLPGTSSTPPRGV